MAGEKGEETVSVPVPGDLADWLDDRAAADGTDREAVVRNLLSAYRSVAEDGGIPESEVPFAPREEVDRRLEEQRQEYVELVEDVRERVIQVKTEADAKAPADHDHPDLRETVEGAAETATEAESTVGEVRSAIDDLASDLERVEREVDSGFDNYEDVLRYLKDVGEENRDHLDVLAAALIDVRSSVERVAAESAARAEAARLQETANRHGFSTADCEECGSTVDLSLLSKAQCPHCSAGLVDVEPKDGFFGSNTLVTGDLPALEGETAGESAEDLERIVEEGPDSDPDFEWDEPEEEEES